tara:strand:- start:973 stop:1482 length:510 start_codon:yes stop_codon:yes gene_type:complete
MSTKLTKNDILAEVLETLVRGWGRKAVRQALDAVEQGGKNHPASLEFGSAGHKSRVMNAEGAGAEQIAQRITTPDHKKELIIKFAKDYDKELAFPKLSDAKRFLAAHNVMLKELKSRNQAFKKMLPILVGMSEKGLMNVITRSRYSGPASLEDISDAINESGRSMRRIS